MLMCNNTDCSAILSDSVFIHHMQGDACPACRQGILHPVQNDYLPYEESHYTQEDRMEELLDRLGYEDDFLFSCQPEDEEIY